MSNNRLFNVILIIFISMLFIIPSDVFAYCRFGADSEYGVVVCDVEMYSASLYDTTLRFTVSSNGDGTFTYCSDGLYGDSLNLIDNVEDTINPSSFYDSDNNLGKCPAQLYAYAEIEAFSDWNLYVYGSRPDITKHPIHYSAGSYFDVIEVNNNNKPWLSSPTIVVPEKLDNCEALLGTDNFSLGWIIKKALLYIKIFAPIIAVILSTFEFIKVLIQNDPENMKKTYKRLIYRLIIAMLLFLIPSIISLLLDIFGFTASNCSL